MKIAKKGLREGPFYDAYHRFMRVGWPLFYLFIILYFALFNLVFALLYWNFAQDGIGNMHHAGFIDFFYFSVQTAASIGYGFFYPESQSAHILVSIEAVGGLLSNALITGLVFARFSRPSARIKFAQNIIWVNYYGKDALMLRLGNARTNRIFEGKGKWVMLKDEVTPEGDRFRKMLDLKLTRSETSIFLLTWTLIHVIDEQSPLCGVTFEELTQSNSEFLLSFSGLDEETAQTLSTHALYSVKDVLRAKKYKDMLHITQEGLREIDFSQIDLIES